MSGKHARSYEQETDLADVNFFNTQYIFSLITAVTSYSYMAHYTLYIQYIDHQYM